MITKLNGINIDNHWKINVPSMLTEIAEGYPSKHNPWIAPVSMLKQVLAELAELAIKIDDPRLHIMMCRLTLYSASDPYSENYQKDIVEQLQKEMLDKNKL